MNATATTRRSGMTKFYRVSCFKAIGGFVREVMWDGIDCHRCRMHGWIACSWDEPDLRFVHLRPMGSSQQSIYTGRMRHGYGQYFMGTGLRVHDGKRNITIESKAVCAGQHGDVVGLAQKRPPAQAALRGCGVPPFPAPISLAGVLVGKKRAVEELQRNDRITVVPGSVA